jgi:hypothetical protein
VFKALLPLDWDAQATEQVVNNPRRRAASQARLLVEHEAVTKHRRRKFLHIIR